MSPGHVGGLDLIFRPLLIFPFLPKQNTPTKDKMNIESMTIEQTHIILVLGFQWSKGYIFLAFLSIQQKAGNSAAVTTTSKAKWLKMTKMAQNGAHCPRSVSALAFGLSFLPKSWLSLREVTGSEVSDSIKVTKWRWASKSNFTLNSRKMHIKNI